MRLKNQKDLDDFTDVEKGHFRVTECAKMLSCFHYIFWSSVFSIFMSKFFHTSAEWVSGTSHRPKREFLTLAETEYSAVLSIPKIYFQMNIRRPSPNIRLQPISERAINPLHLRFRCAD
jgi:hypothetical protein